MNYPAEFRIAGKVFDKIPQDFWDKHPGVLLGTGIFILALPSLRSGAKRIIAGTEANFRYYVDAKYGKPTPVVLEEAEPVLLSEPVVA